MTEAHADFLIWFLPLLFGLNTLVGIALVVLWCRLNVLQSQADENEKHLTNVMIKTSKWKEEK
jgi:hypothetical protein